jgi:hypothetical protein
VSQSTRAKRRRAEQFADQADLCRVLPCVVCFRPRRYDRSFIASVLVGRSVGWFTREQSEPHHAKTRGAGGGDTDTVPLCRSHHRKFHDMGEQSFTERYGIDCREVAALIAAELRGGQ